MARQYVITEEEMKRLLDRLELHALREGNVTKLEDKQVVQDLHRAFIYVVYTWTNEMGFTNLHQR